jgi:hypothetical protein
MDKYKLKYASNTLRLIWQGWDKKKPLSSFAISLIDELVNDFNEQLNKYLRK